MLQWARTGLRTVHLSSGLSNDYFALYLFRTYFTTTRTYGTIGSPSTFAMHAHMIAMVYYVYGTDLGTRIGALVYLGAWECELMHLCV